MSRSKNKNKKRRPKRAKARVIQRGKHGRLIQLDDVTARAMQEQLQRFREKFGRDPNPDDPIVFDPDADEPRPMPVSVLDDQIAEAAHQAGIDEARIYAIKKTGMMIVSGVNDHLFTEEDKAEWAAAVEEFRNLN